MRRKIRPGQHGNADSQEYREHAICVRLSKTEFDDLNKQFDKSGTSTKASFVRNKLLHNDSGNNQKSIYDFAHLIYELNRIGNNVNQIAKRVNQFTVDKNSTIDTNQTAKDLKISLANLEDLITNAFKKGNKK